MRTINDVEMEEVTGGFLGLATVASLLAPVGTAVMVIGTACFSGVRFI
ncbi:conserved hypothetical protein [Xylella fastidiosa M12]|nr:conserved hypothetical protein [Xylella fastidiosa M12]